MKNLRLIALATTALLGTSAAILAACSSDDTVVASTDGGGAPEASRFEAGNDSGGMDAGIDAPSDAPPDVVVPEGGLQLETFGKKVADAMCRTLSRCCYGDPNLDGGAAVDGGGTYDRASCVNLFGSVGFERSLVGFKGLASKASLDVTSGADCLQKIDALTCDLAGPEFEATKAACFAALKGNQTAGQPCDRSIDCVPGDYCDVPDGGGPGTCAPLQPVNGGCATFNTGDVATDLSLADEVCSYRAGGSPKLYCNSIDLAAGIRPRADWKCAAALPTGSQCANTAWCSDSICDPDTNVCTSPDLYFPKSFCSTFVKP